MSWRHVLLFVGLSSLSAASGCETDASVPPTFNGPGTDCLINSDCSEPYVCVFERCHEQCRMKRDCDGELRCVGALEEVHVCQLESEAKCQTDASCPQGLRCAGDGECRDSCFADEDCVDEQVCVRGVCAEPSELDAQGELPRTLPIATCRTDDDCSAAQPCIAGSCQPECRADRDCEAGQRCDAGTCQGESSACETADDCTEPGATCRDGECDCRCKEDVDCGEGMKCERCACQPAPNGACTTSENCVPPYQCIDSLCRYQCLTSRDCSAGWSCDDHTCQPPAKPKEIANAWIGDPVDIAAMMGITRVTGQLHLQGERLTNSDGLESLVRVGELSIGSFAAGTTPLSGLTGLRWIDGDIAISGGALTCKDMTPLIAGLEQWGGSLTLGGAPCPN